MTLVTPVSRFEFTDGKVRSRHNLKPPGTPIEFVTELSLHYAGLITMYFLGFGAQPSRSIRCVYRADLILGR